VAGDGAAAATVAPPLVATDARLTLCAAVNGIICTSTLSAGGDGLGSRGAGESPTELDSAELNDTVAAGTGKYFADGSEAFGPAGAETISMSLIEGGHSLQQNARCTVITEQRCLSRNKGAGQLSAQDIRGVTLTGQRWAAPVAEYALPTSARKIKHGKDCLQIALELAAVSDRDRAARLARL
jgi:hypothetical protein